MPDSFVSHNLAVLDAERSARIKGIFSRGMQLARQAYESKSSLEDFGGKMMDRSLVGTHLNFAHGLLKLGDVDSVQKACHIISEILDMQETHPLHPHRGNWPRWVGDEEVTDLNSAPFILRWFIPLLITYENHLTSEMLTRCQHCLHLALEEIERLNVSVTYTNIHLKCIFALIVGGQWLDDLHFQITGKQLWDKWVDFTVKSGAPREYNSATYMGMNLTMLAKLQHYARDPHIRLQARVMYERFWLHAILHLHKPTRQLTGPHARCYWHSMISGKERLNEIMWRETGWTWLIEPGPYQKQKTVILPANIELALTQHWMPTFAARWLAIQDQVLPFEVRETASRDEGYDLTTFHTASFALGTASRTYDTGTGLSAIEMMANHMMLHYRDPEQPGGWGMMYSRYVVNDQHWGSIRSFSFRPTTNFFDQGEFAGIQQRNKAICLYALKPLHDTYVRSLKIVVVFQSGADLDQVWVNDKPVQWGTYKETMHAADWIIVDDGAVYIGICPLNPSCLGRETPILFEQGPLGEMFLSIYNYKGPEKRFWEYASLSGAYWSGNIRAGFVIEVGEKSDYSSALAFLNHLRKSRLNDIVDDNHNRLVTYSSGNDKLRLEYDLLHTKPGERWLNEDLYDPPHLLSPLAVQGDSGVLNAGSATLITNPQPVWFIAQELDLENRCWIAVNPQSKTTPIKIKTPFGAITSSAWGMGSIAWHASPSGEMHVIIDTVRKPEDLEVPEGISVHYRQTSVE